MKIKVDYLKKGMTIIFKGKKHYYRFMSMWNEKIKRLG